jgi:F0F1-type ATP synthase membrane subunit b/b'
VEVGQLPGIGGLPGLPHGQNPAAGLRRPDPGYYEGYGGVRQDADERAADVERRLAAIDTEIAALRAESREETTAEADRLARHTAAEVARIQAQSEREIGDAGKDARIDLRRYTAGLAIDLAAQKIRARMTPATEDRFVRGFVRDLK